MSRPHKNCPLSRGCARCSPCWLRQGRGVLCLQMAHKCFWECMAFLYCLKFFQLPLLPPLPRFPGGCVGKKSNIYTTVYARFEMRPTWRWDTFFLALTCGGGQIRCLGRAKKAPFCGRGVPTAGECLKFISEFRQKVQKCNLLLTFCQFWGILKTKSLSTSVRCKGTGSTEGFSPFSPYALGERRGDLWMRAKFRRFLL